jgi:predicted GNAT superfamily acetyltransferase
MDLREPTPADWPRLLELNLASVQELSDLDESRLQSILSLAHRSLVVENEGEVVAFAVAMPPGVRYDSDNYRWFSAHFEHFLYLDRVVVAESLRRRGIGAQLYDAMEAAALPFGRMVCEVNVVPLNEISLAFHASRGYVEIGRLEHSAEKVVALMSKELQPSG